MSSKTTEPQVAASSPRLLLVSPEDQDRDYLDTLLHDRRWRDYGQASWSLDHACSIDSAIDLLNTGSFPIVLSEGDLGGKTWRDMHSALKRLANPPYLIVASRQADAYLWAEALNLGVYDVLPKPFESAEVIRVVSIAYVRWMQNHSVPQISGKSQPDRSPHPTSRHSAAHAANSRTGSRAMAQAAGLFRS